MSQSMKEIRETSRLVRVGRRLSLILSKESIFGSVGSPKEKDRNHHESSSVPSSPSISSSSSPLRRSTTDSIYPPGRGGIPTPECCRVFGVDLETAVARSNRLHKTLPEVVYKCFVYLHEKGVDEEGIFRMSGSATEILKLKGQFNLGSPYDLTTCLNPHTVSGLLKLFLRELPQPLFPTEIDTTEGDLLGRIKAMVESLPKENKCLMSCLFWLLHKVSKAEQVTKMSIQNLVIVFSATLNCSGTILTKVIKHTMDIFPENMLEKTEIEPAVDLSSKSIQITSPVSPASEPVVVLEEDIFVVEEKVNIDTKTVVSPDIKTVVKIDVKPQSEPKGGIEIGRRGRGEMRRARTKTIFDSDDESEEPHNDLKSPASQSVPVRNRSFFR